MACRAVKGLSPQFRTIWKDNFDRDSTGNLNGLKDLCSLISCPLSRINQSRQRQVNSLGDRPKHRHAHPRQLGSFRHHRRTRLRPVTCQSRCLYCANSVPEGKYRETAQCHFTDPEPLPMAATWPATSAALIATIYLRPRSVHHGGRPFSEHV